jgi:hypothetical protein
MNEVAPCPIAAMSVLMKEFAVSGPVKSVYIHLVIQFFAPVSVSALIPIVAGLCLHPVSAHFRLVFGFVDFQVFFGVFLGFGDVVFLVSDGLCLFYIRILVL